ncbi:MAG TPA: aldehyde dehydrogenase family protein, partial [Candidatus Thioglobus sp.]|nr:aldehyde dehydrogenase family protein [Candidatus Thioglobus sp.]
MLNLTNFYINGQWTKPIKSQEFIATNPATQGSIATISLGSGADVDRAVESAREAFKGFSRTTVDERLALLQKLLDIYMDRYEEMAQSITLEMGAPIEFSRN